MAVKNVSFYGQGQRAPIGGGKIQRDYQTDPRRQMEQQLMAQGGKMSPVQSPMEGIYRALSGVAGGYFAGQGRREMEGKEAERQKKMADVLAGVSAPVETAPALNVPPEFANMGAAINRDPTAMEQQGRLVQGISGIDADAGMSMQMQLMQNQIAQQQATAASDLAFQRQKELKAAPGAPSTVGNDPTSNMRDFARLQQLQKEFPPIDGKDSPEVATFKDFVSKSNLLNVGSGFVPFNPATGGAGAEIPRALPPEKEPDYLKLAAGSTKAGGQAIDASTKAFEALDKVRVGLTNIDDAIAAIDAGAASGPIYNMLPSIRSSSVELDNLQKRMGLDVIGNVTFGALSKGELDLALDVALPTALSPPELRKWLENKRVAQQKLSKYLSDAAIYLGTPGNTRADWAEMMKAKQETTGGASTEDAAARQWATENPDDPRAAEILKRLGL